MAMPVKISRYSFHCFRVPVLQWSLQFLVRVFTFLSLILWYSYFGTFLSTWFIIFFFCLKNKYKNIRNNYCTYKQNDYKPAMLQTNTEMKKREGYGWKLQEWVCDVCMYDKNFLFRWMRETKTVINADHLLNNQNLCRWRYIVQIF